MTSFEKRRYLTVKQFVTQTGRSNQRRIAMKKTTLLALPLAMFALAGCAGDQSVSASSSIFRPASSRSTVSDPTATWKIPLADANLALKSDHAYGDGTYSLYANGVCNVSGKIFATTAASNSGDATLQTSTATKGKCGRLITLAYPDGYTESIAIFANLHELENTSYAIPIGSTVTRRLVLDGGVIPNSTSRCGKLHFGVGPIGDRGVGSDSLLVTRVDASTWQVKSQAAPNDKALCENNGQIYEMAMSFTIVSSYPLN
jgi:hypothetical protein